jgi:hypothetical protein
MNKQVYSYLWMVDPETGIRNRAKINSAYGFKNLEVMYFTDGNATEVDLTYLRNQLADYAVFPHGCTLMVDRQGSNWWPQDWNVSGDVASPTVVARLIKLIIQIKVIRPDVKCGYYNIVPLSRYRWEVDYCTDRNIAFQFDKQLSHLAEHCRVLFPCFYAYSSQPIQCAITRIQQTLCRARTLYGHDKKIIPLLWPHWYDVADNIPWDDKDAWTPELLAKANIPGEYFGALLNAISDCKINDVALWVAGWPPFNKDVPWFQSLLKWRSS